MANWQASAARGIIRRIVVTGTLVLDTPASFSTGETDGTELIILQDALEGLPLLPGASLAGALRSYLLSRELGYRAANTDTTLTTALFGKALDDGTERMQSRLMVQDALGQGTGTLTRREGVKIAGDTRTADDGMLFSTQVWEAGTTFDLCFELVLYDGYPEALLVACAAALNALGSGEITLGGRKQRGYGRVRVVNWQVSDYDLRQPDALMAWLQGQPHSVNPHSFLTVGDALGDARTYVHITATLQLCESLLIRAASDIAESEHLSSNGQPVLSGTSLTGALRARCLKIANLVNPAHAEWLVNDLFGKHGANNPDGTNGNSDTLSASRVRISEQPISGGRMDYIQNRVKIDRFTGGAFETALFDERPLFADDNTTVQLDWLIRYPADQHDHERLNAQVGLLLLALKDLWTEDLPLGGEASVGRGRWRGQRGTLTVKQDAEAKPIIINLTDTGLSDVTQRETLERFVQTLLNYNKPTEAAS